jgi:hypothetical protein
VKLQLDQANWLRRRHHDGFNLVVAHPDLKIPAVELCQLYRAKDLIEHDFRTIKSFLDLRPIGHHTDAKVRAHVTICMLALLLERTLHHKLNAKHTPQAALEMLQTCHLNRLAPTSTDDLSVYTLTQPTSDQTAILRLLRMQSLADQQQVADRIVPR